MKTTLNLPDALVSRAKIRAVYEKTTLTNLLVQGLELRLERGKAVRSLPVSRAGGGLKPGLDWRELHRQVENNEAYR